MPLLGEGGNALIHHVFLWRFTVQTYTERLGSVKWEYMEYNPIQHTLGKTILTVLFEGGKT